MKNKTHTTVQINLLPPAIFISLLLAAFKLLGFVDISWLLVLSPVIAVISIVLIIFTLIAVVMLAYAVLAAFNKK